jgi:uncharacterized protein
MNDPERPGPVAAGAAVRDNPDAHRYEIAIGAQTAFLEYRRRPGVVVLVHTEVPPALRRQGLGAKLARFALDSARAAGLRTVVLCPFVKTYLERHPELRTAAASDTTGPGRDGA